MRILMIVPKYPPPVVGGLERQAHELSKALVQQGHTVIALSSRFDRMHTKVERLDGVLVYRVAWFESNWLRFAVSPFLLARAQVALMHNVDAVHVHCISWLGAFATVFAKALGLPVITKLPNVRDFGIPAMNRGLFGCLRVALLKSSDAIIAMTSESLEELDAIRYPSQQILKVTNGISLVPLRSRLPRPSDAVEVLFVGRLEEAKGVHELLDAWRVVRLRATRPARLRVIGDGPLMAEQGKSAAVPAADRTIEFLGYREDVPSELERADVFVLPSHAEGNSNAILEAMRAGLPIVATDVGGTSMQVGPEGQRFLVQPGDREALGERLTELIEDEPLRRRLGAAMRARVEALFTIDRVASTYAQAYDFISSGHREKVGRIQCPCFALGH
jgi:glycosyltransferase involved in cell wall biosynthesis